MAKYLNTDGLTHLVELIKNGMAPKEHKHSFSDMIEDTAPVAKQIIGEIVEKDLVNQSGAIGEMTVYGNTRQNMWLNPGSRTSSGVTLTANADGSVTVSGTATANSWILADTYYMLKPSTTYTLSVDNPLDASGGITNYAGFYVSEFDSSNNELEHMIPFGSTHVTFTTRSDTVKALCVFRCYSGTTVSGTYRVMLNEGSKVEPWCPPGLNGVEELSIVTAGKNLLARLGHPLPSTINGITFSDNGDGGIKIQGTAAGTAYFNFFNAAGAGTAPFLPAGTYTISCQGLSGAIGNFTVQIYDDKIGGGYRAWLSIISDTDTGTIDRGGYIRPYISVANGVTVDTVLYPQIERGSAATAYEPPNTTTTPIDLQGNILASLPDGTKDELTIDDAGNVTLLKNVGAETFDGTENWQRYVQNASYLTLYGPMLQYSHGIKGSASDVKLRAIADTVPYHSYVDSPAYSTNKVCISTTTAASPKHVYINVPGNPDTIAKARAWLTSNPTTFFYKLATPRTIDLGHIELPSVKSEKMNVWIDANLPTQLESTIIDLPILPIASGGTGADNTEEARSNLDVYSKAEVDEKLEDISIDEVVPISKGGTGKITAKAAQNALLGVMEEVETDPGDDTTFVMRYASPDDTKGAVFVRKASHVWNWIKSKADALYLPKAGGTVSGKLTLSGGSDYIGNDYYIAYPGGGSLNSTAQSEVGFLKIILPVSWNSTMLKFKVSIFNYVNNSGADFFISGYNYYVDSFWAQCTAYSIGDGAIANLPVVFGHDGTKCVIAIGSATTKWSYPQVSVSDVTIGFSGGTYSAWKSGWKIGVDATAIQNVDITISNPLVGQGTYAAASHTHTIANITNLQSTLDGKAASSHKHSAADITSGTLPLARGGTGGADAATARTNLSVYSKTEVDAKLENAITALDAYPIGSVYISYVSTSPASLFGGTWTPITGVFPYFNAGTATGGSNDAIVVEHTHTATAANAGSHTHGASTNSAGAHSHTIGADDDAQFKENSGTSSVHRAGATGAHRYPGTSSAGSHSHSVTVNSAGDHTHTITVASAGSSGTGKNMPAYQTLYAWRRTA